MASIKEGTKNGKVVFYFTVCFGKDENGKQIRKYKTWMPPIGMTRTKAKKEAEIQAALWEQSLKEEAPPPAVEQPRERKDDFVSFI